MMTWTAFSFLITGVLLNAGAQLLLKAGTNVLGVITLSAENWPAQVGRMGLEPHIVEGLGCYGVSVIVWIVGLSRVPESVAYPLVSLGFLAHVIPASYLL